MTGSPASTTRWTAAIRVKAALTVAASAFRTADDGAGGVCGWRMAGDGDGSSHRQPAETLGERRSTQVSPSNSQHAAAGSSEAVLVRCPGVQRPVSDKGTPDSNRQVCPYGLPVPNGGSLVAGGNGQNGTGQDGLGISRGTEIATSSTILFDCVMISDQPN